MTLAALKTTTEPQGASIILNATAAGNRKRGIQQIQELRNIPGITLHVTESLEDLARVADALADQPPEYVAISGGDGTISHTLSALKLRMKDVPPVVIMPGGSMNMVANSVGASKDVIAVARALASGFQPVRREVRDTLRVGDRYGFIFGLGLVTNFLEVYYGGTYTGPRRAAAVLGRTIGSTFINGNTSQQIFKKCEGRLQAGSVDEIRPWTVVLAETIKNLGIGFNPCYRAFEQSGTFHVLGTEMATTRFIRHLSYVYKGRPWPEQLNMLDEIADRLVFNSPGKILYTVDGELLETHDRVEARIDRPTRFAIFD